MATKPTETLNFEPPDTSGAITITVAVPTDKQAAGFLPAEKPPGQYFNWLFRTLSRLYNYVKDGNFTGNHTITGTLGVTGLISSAGGVALTGTAKLSHAATRYIPLHANAFIESPTATVNQRTQNSLSLNPCIAFAGVPLVSGTRITSIRLLVQPQGTATIRGVFHSADINTGGSPADIVTNTSSGTTSQILTATGLSVDIADDSVYTFYVEEVASSGGSNSRIFGAIFGFITPP